MKTEDKLGKTLKELMVTEPLDTITVKRLSTLCGINRQTFYYHFRDIYDLLTWIFLNESVHGVDQCKSWQEVHCRSCNCTKKEFGRLFSIQNSTRFLHCETIYGS